MRLILIENARRKQSKKRGGTLNRVDLTLLQPDEDARHEELIALDEDWRSLAMI